MPAFATISPDKLARLVGTPKCPVVLDVRSNDAVAADPRVVPGALMRPPTDAANWAPTFSGRSVVAVCHRGLKLSHGAAGWLREAGADAVVLEGGHEAWKASGLPLVPLDRIPPRNAQGRTVWVTRARPKVDRIACPWLIRRFIDPTAAFLFVAASEVAGVAEHFDATPFDVENVTWSHDGKLCTFDVMVDAFGLASPALLHLAKIVRAADTAHLELAPEAAGLLAASLGLSRMYSDDLSQLEAGLTLYDAFYRWCRDASEETHDWPAKKKT